jgi:hypothetical protein
VVPVVPPFQSPARPLTAPPRGPVLPWDNPNAPIVDPVTHGVKDVAVFLRGIDPARSRPWDHPSPRVELEGYHLRIRQGQHVSRFGFVRHPAGTVEMLSADEGTYSVRARGAAFFCLPFPDPHRPCIRPLKHKGVVELSTGTGQFWMRGYLLVDDHPYYTRTDADGRFLLYAVPEGEYELVCWVPNWQTAHRERDSDAVLTTRLSFRPPVELVQRVSVRRGREQRVECAVSAAMFNPTSSR